MTKAEIFELSLDDMDYGVQLKVADKKFACEGLDNNVSLICNMLKTSKDVKIFVKDITNSAYTTQKFIDILENYLFNGNKLEMIIMNSDSYLDTFTRFRKFVEDNKLYKYTKNFSLKMVTEDIEVIEKYPCFTINTDAKFRIEVKGIHLNSVCSFNDIVKVAEYLNVFAVINKNSRNIYDELC